MRRKPNAQQPTSMKPAVDQGPTERELATVRGIIDHWKRSPRALHEFRRAVFGQKNADWMRQRDFPRERYEEAAREINKCDEVECKLFFVKSRDEVVDKLCLMAGDPDNQTNRDWLLHCEFFLDNPRPSRK